MEYWITFHKLAQNKCTLRVYLLHHVQLISEEININILHLLEKVYLLDYE